MTNPSAMAELLCALASEDSLMLLLGGHLSMFRIAESPIPMVHHQVQYITISQGDDNCLPVERSSHLVCPLIQCQPHIVPDP